MKIKPLLNVDENDISVFFSHINNTGDKGQLVSINGSGYVNGNNFGIFANMNPGANAGNVFTPRWEVKSKVRTATSNEKPYGVLLYDIREFNIFGESLLRDPIRKHELQAVVSGEGVPILRRGTLLVGPWPTGAGQQPTAGNFAISSGNGEWTFASGRLNGVTGTNTGLLQTDVPLYAFGKFIGGVDADGYAAVDISCYI